MLRLLAGSLLAAGVAIAGTSLASGGVSVAGGGSARSFTPPATSHPTPASNRKAAKRAVRRMLEAAPLPQGATRVSGDESVGSALLHTGQRPAVPSRQVIRHAYWRVSSEPQEVLAWVEEHAPQASRLVSTGGSEREIGAPPPRSLPVKQRMRYIRSHSVRTSWEVVFGFSPPKNVLSVQWLEVSLAAAKGGGTAVRVEAIADWTPVRPASERIPRHLASILIKVSDRRKKLHFAESVRSRAEVKRIVTMVESLQRPNGGAISCPMDDGKAAIINLYFLATSSSSPLARVRIDDNGCGSVSFWRGGRKQPELGSAWEAKKALHAILKRAL